MTASLKEEYDLLREWNISVSDTATTANTTTTTTNAEPLPSSEFQWVKPIKSCATRRSNPNELFHSTTNLLGSSADAPDEAFYRLHSLRSGAQPIYMGRRFRKAASNGVPEKPNERVMYKLLHPEMQDRSAKESMKTGKKMDPTTREAQSAKVTTTEQLKRTRDRTSGSHGHMNSAHMAEQLLALDPGAYMRGRFNRQPPWDPMFIQSYLSPNEKEFENNAIRPMKGYTGKREKVIDIIEDQMEEEEVPPPSVNIDRKPIHQNISLEEIANDNIAYGGTDGGYSNAVNAENAAKAANAFTVLKPSKETNVTNELVGNTCTSPKKPSAKENAIDGEQKTSLKMCRDCIQDGLRFGTETQRSYMDLSHCGRVINEDAIDDAAVNQMIINQRKEKEEIARRAQIDAWKEILRARQAEEKTKEYEKTRERTLKIQERQENEKKRETMAQKKKQERKQFLTHANEHKIEEQPHIWYDRIPKTRSPMRHKPVSTWDEEVMKNAQKRKAPKEEEKFPCEDHYNHVYSVSKYLIGEKERKAAHEYSEALKKKIIAELKWKNTSLY